MDNIIISRITSTAPQYQQVFEVRDAVLRKPLGRSLKDDDLSRDHTDDIFIAEYDGKVIGCVLLHQLEGTEVQLRAMAVYSDWQGRGVGRMLVAALEEHSWQTGSTKIVLHGRKVALGFYSSLGYTITSDEFTEVGIPHFLMEKSRPY